MHRVTRRVREVTLLVKAQGGLTLFGIVPEKWTTHDEHILSGRVAGGPRKCPKNTNSPPPHKPPRASYEITEQMHEHCH